MTNEHLLTILCDTGGCNESLEGVPAGPNYASTSATEAHMLEAGWRSVSLNPAKWPKDFCPKCSERFGAGGTGRVR